MGSTAGPRILVLVKQVPEVTEQSLDPETGRLRRDGVELLMNPFDRRAALEACRLRDDAGGGWVGAVTMGPPQAESILRECLALGFDEAFHLCDPGFGGADTLATARALADVVAPLRPDLILAGRYSIDAETGQVPAEVAAFLGAAHLPGARRLDLERDPERSGGFIAVAECEGDDGAITGEAICPVVVTCTDRWKTSMPRRLPDEEREKSAPVATLGVKDLPGPADVYGSDGSPTWVEKVRMVPLVREQRQLAAEGDLDRVAREVLDLVRQKLTSAAAEETLPAIAHKAGRPAGPGGIVVIGELDPEGQLRPVTFELLAAADQLASHHGVGVSAFLLGPVWGQEPEWRKGGDASAAISTQLGHYGADYWIRPRHDSETALGAIGVLESAIEQLEPRIALGPATALGRDQLPHLAARLGLGLTGDAIGVEIDAEGQLLALKPAFGGQLVAPIASHTLPAFATLRAGVLDRAEPDSEREPAKILEFSDEETLMEPHWRDFQRETEIGCVDLDQASVVVCAGFGLGGAEQIEKVAALADKLGGVVCGTRRVCDLGWLPRQAQVGLSGRYIGPHVYLGLGVRGSFNHTVGIRRAGTVVGVNNNPNAEIFAASDLGVLGDAPAMLDAMLAIVRG
jgi:electron transfer flavoprotein alpha subunit